MLTITVPGVESWDDDLEEFVTTDSTVLQLEHSLVSLSKWESKWEKPFLADNQKSTEETIDYISSMSLQGDIPVEVISRLTDENVAAINSYIESKMTATWFNEAVAKKGARNTEAVTAEIIYHWMVALQIPFECENWHLNRLITLVKVVNEKNAAAADAQKKAPPTSAQLADRRRLNEQRRAEAAAARGA